MSAGKKPGDYAVGYRKPPVGRRFQPGVSGNPRGRPRGSKGVEAILKAELDEWVSITENGKTRRLRKRALVIKALANKAIKGETLAIDKLLRLVMQAEGGEGQHEARRPLSESDQLILERLLASTPLDDALLGAADGHAGSDQADAGEVQ